ncbi:hypothetical protein BS78_08G126400 [Paspalum vaginatum]|nr:hypothetical protein BS78_08G126400 [Paspalum vaginatum]
MMVEKGCENCRKWQEHYYWEHMDVSKFRFFKFMSIPDKFAKNFNWGDSLDLKAPSGEIWNTGIAKHASKVFLMSAGWEDFVKAHELQAGDLLIFTCSGKSSVDVLIFEPSGCEKISSLFGNITSPNTQEHFNDMADKGRQSQGYSMSDCEDTATPSQMVGSSFHYASTSKKPVGRHPRRRLESPESSNDHVKQGAIDEEESDEENANSNCYYSVTANRLCDEEKEKVSRLVWIQPDNPAFVTVLKMSHVRRRSNYLIFPSQFAADHLDSRLQEITLLRPNRKEKWCVKYYHTADARGIRNHNFYKFVQDNNLREGDICAFELMKAGRKVTMTVHAVRKDADRFALVP